MPVQTWADSDFIVVILPEPGPTLWRLPSFGYTSPLIYFVTIVNIIKDSKIALLTEPVDEIPQRRL